MPAPDSVLQVLDARFDEAVEELIALARIPSVSAPGFDPAEVERSAAAVAELLRSVGLESVELLRVPGAHPYVLAEWMGAGEEAPTLVLYAHHDVQPPGRIDYWETPAFDPTDRGDGRLYGRGVVDDKAGVIVYAAAIRAWLEAEGGLPVNIKWWWMEKKRSVPSISQNFSIVNANAYVPMWWCCRTPLTWPKVFLRSRRVYAGWFVWMFACGRSIIRYTAECGAALSPMQLLRSLYCWVD